MAVYFSNKSIHITPFTMDSPNKDNNHFTFSMCFEPVFPGFKLCEILLFGIYWLCIGHDLHLLSCTFL